MKNSLKNLIICVIILCGFLNSIYAQNAIIKLKKNSQYSHKKSTYQIGLEDLDMDGDLDLFYLTSIPENALILIKNITH